MNTKTYYTYFDSPLGKIFVQGDGESITGLYFPSHKHWKGPDSSWTETAAPFKVVGRQLSEYFAGQRQDFEVWTMVQGTEFQQAVWRELIRIPFGETITYAQLSQRIGMPTATRAVGNANGRNPISIIVPCHRVIGANGTLTGYGGGLERKQWLLDWERQQSNARLFGKDKSLFGAGVPTSPLG